MKISALSATSGVSVATIKFYLREGLIPSGRPTGPRTAEYDVEHVNRLEVVRGLREVANLPVESIRQLMMAVNDESVTAFGLMAMAHAAVIPAHQYVAENSDLAEHLYHELGWKISSKSPVFAMTSGLLNALEREGVSTSRSALAPWVNAARIAASAGTSTLRPNVSRAQLVRDVAVGTFLGNQLMLVLHMASQIDNMTK